MTVPFSFEDVKTVNRSAAFNRWAAIEVLRASEGEAEISIRWREEFGQYVGFLHAGLISALLDTACGFAAATVAGNVLASHISVSCVAPALGDTFTASGQVIRAGRRQIFTRGRLDSVSGGAASKLVAVADVLLTPAAAG